MAHYAILDANNIVVRVITGRDEGDVGGNGEEGIDWEEHYGGKRTSYNTRGGIHYMADNNTPSSDQSKSFRKNYAGIGYSYDSKRDAFIPPKPFASWTLNEQTCLWEPPIAMPKDNRDYEWDEDSLSWIPV